MQLVVRASTSYKWIFLLSLKSINSQGYQYILCSLPFPSSIFQSPPKSSLRFNMSISNAREGLAIAEIVFYVPALCIAAFVAHRHGFKRQDGWIYLVILSLARIIGYGCGLAAQQQSNPSQDLIETATVLSSVGLSPLILAMLGMLSRV